MQIDISKIWCFTGHRPVIVEFKRENPKVPTGPQGINVVLRRMEV